MYTAPNDSRQQVRRQVEIPPHLIFYRPLTPVEADSVWALLNSPLISGRQQELHLIIRRETNGQLTGWMTQTAERAVLHNQVVLTPSELSQ